MSPRATSLGAFVGMITGLAAVSVVNFRAPRVSFLWHNLVAVVVVLAVGLALSALSQNPQPARAAAQR
jgi:Na+/proline symporter